MPSEGVPKCQRCRRDHKKCSPENRKWPGPKCDRCESYGYECSENMMARRSSQNQKEDMPRQMRGFMQDFSQAKYFECQQNATQSVTIRPPPTPTISTIQLAPSSQSFWRGLFGYLRDVDWINLTYTPVSAEPDTFTAMFRSAICSTCDLSETPLGKRQMYLEAFLQSQSLAQHTPSTLLSTSPLDASINALTEYLQRNFPHMAMAFSFEDLVNRCGEYVRYGSCWSILRMSLQTDEILLIDPTYSFDAVDPITTFEIAERLWLYPDVGLKQFCQKLSGLSQMISDLARTDLNSEARHFLAAKILDRLEEVLGTRTALPDACVLNYAASPTSPTSFYSMYGVNNSPVETVDGDVYSLTDSLGADGSEDGFPSIEGRAYPTLLSNACLNDHLRSDA